MLNNLKKTIQIVRDKLNKFKNSFKTNYLQLFLKNDNGQLNLIEIKERENFDKSMISLNNLELKEMHFEELLSIKKHGNQEEITKFNNQIKKNINKNYYNIKYHNRNPEVKTNLLNENLESQSKSLIHEQDFINNLIMKEDFKYLDKNSRGLLEVKSQKTLNLLTDLKKMRLKNVNQRANKTIWDDDDEEEEELSNGNKFCNQDNNHNSISKSPSHLNNNKQSKENENIKKPIQNIDYDQSIIPIYTLNQKLDSEKIRKPLVNDQKNEENNDEEDYDYSKIAIMNPLINKLTRKINSNKLIKIVNVDVKDANDKFADKSSAAVLIKKKPLLKKENTQFIENGNLSAIIKRNDDDRGDDEEKNHDDINNKIDIINKLLVGVINKGIEF